MLVMSNAFLEAVSKYDTYTENGAVSHSTTGSKLLDYFAKSATFRNRELTHVFADMGKLWNESPKIALQIVFYNRMISRMAKGDLETETVQKGQGNRSEFRKCLVWLARFQPETLYKNLWLVPLVGTWKDLWHADLINDLKTDEVYALVKKGVESDYNRGLIAKYLPRIRSRANTFNERHLQTNQFAYGLIKYLGWSPKEYRQFKSSGSAHDFQRKMCANQWDEINFGSISGKALFQFANNRGMDQKTTLERHNQESRYIEWIKAQPTAKFTGYVHELMKGVNRNLTLAQKYTIDKQFEGVLELATKDKKITENIWCALDTSGSMQARVANTSAFEICLGLGIYFSTLNEGAFRDHVIMFDKESKLMKLSGSFSDKALQLLSATTAWGTTNFQSVIDEIVRVRNSNRDIPISDYPSTLIVVSDMQFNPTEDSKTNYETAIKKLKDVGLPPIRIVWWWVTGRAEDFPNQLDDEGVVMLGGFDGAIISNLLGEEVETSSKASGGKAISKDSTPHAAMLKALDQEVLKMISI